MTKTPLSDYMKLKNLSQAEMAELVKLTQGAISKMLLRDRAIFVVEGEGPIKLLEEKLVAQARDSVSQEEVA